jgi:hypothetical protein
LTEQRRLRNEETIPADRRALIDYGGYLSFNYLSLDEDQRQNRVFRQYDASVYVNVNIDGVHEFFARGRASYLDFHDGDNPADEDDDETDGELERAHYRLDLAERDELGSASRTTEELSFRLGRQFAFWSNGLALGQVIDGARVVIRKSSVEMEFIAGVSQQESVDFDTSRPDFDDHTRRAFYGAMANANIGQHKFFAYGLGQQDHNHDGPVRLAGDIETQFEYNSYYVGTGVAGALNDRFAYSLEMTLERGSGLSNSFRLFNGELEQIEQTDEDLEAWAASVKVDYLFADPTNGRLSGEIVLASGDPDRRHTSNTFSGNERGTSDTAYNGFGILNTGIAFTPVISNLAMLRVGISTFPIPRPARFARLQIGADLFLFNKLDDDAPIDEATATGEAYLGWEPDLFLNWQLLPDVTLALRYGIFFPGDAFDENDPRHSFFFAITYSF